MFICIIKNCEFSKSIFDSLEDIKVRLFYNSLKVYIIILLIP